MAERLDIEVTDNGSAGRVQKSISSIGKEAASAGYSVRSLSHLLGVLGAGMIVGEFVRYADEWQNIHNKLINVTSSSQNLIAVNDALFAGAQKSRTAYSEFVNVYQELAIQATRFGTSQQQMTDITTTMMQAAQLAHPSVAAMKAGVEQLILSMERGRLATRGFSALLKDTPQLAMALADGLGISINKLRELAHHSQITAAQIVTALEKAGPEVAEKFLKLTPTIAGAMVVLHNGWIKFIGDLDNSTGILTGITGLIIGMSHHIDILAMVLVAFGSVATLVFSQIAKRAILSMWAALLAAGPVAWAIAAIGMIAGALVLFGDKVAVTKDGMVSLLDYVKGAFATIGDVVGAVAGFVADIWEKIKGPVGGFFAWLISGWLALQAANMAIFKAIGNFIIGTFVFAYNEVVLAFTELPGALENIFVKVFNWLSEKFGALVNTIIDGINSVSNFAGLGSISHITPQSYGADTGAAAAYAKHAGAAAGKAYGEDYVGEAAGAIGRGAKFVNDAVMRHAREFSAARHAGGGGAVGTDHGDPEDDPGNPKKHHPDRTKTRAELIAEEMKSFGDKTKDANNLDNTFLNRKAFEEVTKFNDDLQKHKDKAGHFFPAMSADEKAALYTTVMGLEAATRLQKERDKVMEAAIGPRLVYQEQEIAIGQLLQHHSITAAEAAKADRDAAIAFLSTQEDVASGLKLGALNILKEMQARGPQVANAMKGIWDAQQGPLLQYQTSLMAVNALLERQLITAQQAGKASRDAAISYFDAQTDAASGVTRALLKIQRTAQDAATQMETAITDAFKGMEDAFVALATGSKVDVGGFLKTIQTDVARSTFQQAIGGPLASFLQSKFGVSVPGLAGKVGESRANPMWVRNADVLPGQEVLSSGKGLGGLLGGLLGGGGGGAGGSFGVDIGQTPLGGNTHPWDESWHKYNQDTAGVLQKGSTQFASAIGAAIALAAPSLGAALGLKKNSVGSALLDIGVAVGTAFLTHYANSGGGGGGGSGGGSSGGGSGGKYATGTDFMVGGAGGVDSQLVQFRASPGEKVSVQRAGEAASGGGRGGDLYTLNIDARGTSADLVEQRVEAALARAMPEARKVAKADAVKEIGNRVRRQRMPGAR